jgi:hypothetical protein
VQTTIEHIDGDHFHNFLSNLENCASLHEFVFIVAWKAWSCHLFATADLKFSSWPGAKPENISRAQWRAMLTALREALGRIPAPSSYTDEDEDDVFWDGASAGA